MVWISSVRDKSDCRPVSQIRLLYVYKAFLLWHLHNEALHSPFALSAEVLRRDLSCCNMCIKSCIPQPFSHFISQLKLFSCSIKTLKIVHTGFCQISHKTFFWPLKLFFKGNGVLHVVAEKWSLPVDLHLTGNKIFWTKPELGVFRFSGWVKNRCQTMSLWYLKLLRKLSAVKKNKKKNQGGPSSNSLHL